MMRVRTKGPRIFRRQKIYFVRIPSKAANFSKLTLQMNRMKITNIIQVLVSYSNYRLKAQTDREEILSLAHLITFPKERTRRSTTLRRSDSS